MTDFRASDTAVVQMRVGQQVTLESLRQAVVPPYLMLLPFLEVPACVRVVKQEGLEEDGVHGCIFTLEGLALCEGKLRVGFRDLQNGQVTHEKTIAVKVTTF